MITMFNPEKMRYQMALRGYSSSAVAKKIGANVNTIQRTLRGATKPKPQTLKAIADVLDCSVSDFYDIDRTSMTFFERLRTMFDKETLDRFFENADDEKIDAMWKNYLCDAFDNGATDEAVTGSIKLVKEKGYEYFCRLMETLLDTKSDYQLNMRLDENGEIYIYLPEEEFDHMQKVLKDG